MLTNAKHTLAYVTYTPLVLTHADRTCALANLDMLEMDAIVQVLSIVSERKKEYLPHSDMYGSWIKKRNPGSHV